MGVSPKRVSAGGFNPQKLKVVRNGYGTDDIIYVERPDLPPVVLYSGGMSEADRHRNTIALESVNAYLRRNGDPPAAVARKNAEALRQRQGARGGRTSAPKENDPLGILD